MFCFWFFFPLSSLDWKLNNKHHYTWTLTLQSAEKHKTLMNHLSGKLWQREVNGQWRIWNSSTVHFRSREVKPPTVPWQQRFSIDISHKTISPQAPFSGCSGVFDCVTWSSSADGVASVHIYIPLSTSTTAYPLCSQGESDSCGQIMWATSKDDLSWPLVVVM